jgi:hypothetical protein
MATNKRWREADDSTLRDLYLRNIEVSVIASILQRSERAVSYRANADLKLRRPRKREEQPIKKKRREYLDCMPNPFINCTGFDINFYRKL